MFDNFCIKMNDDYLHMKHYIIGAGLQFMYQNNEIMGRGCQDGQ